MLCNEQPLYDCCAQAVHSNFVHKYRNTFSPNNRQKLIIFPLSEINLQTKQQQQHQYENPILARECKRWQFLQPCRLIMQSNYRMFLNKVSTTTVNQHVLQHLQGRVNRISVSFGRRDNCLLGIFLDFDKRCRALHAIDDMANSFSFHFAQHFITLWKFQKF